MIAQTDEICKAYALNHCVRSVDLHLQKAAQSLIAPYLIFNHSMCLQAKLGPKTLYFGILPKVIVPDIAETTTGQGWG